MKYDQLSKEELVEKINHFEAELKGYVSRLDQRYKVFFERAVFQHIITLFLCE